VEGPAVHHQPLTHIAATLPRADTRDVLLVKRDWLEGRDRNELRVLSTSARRRTNLSGFLQWALPTRPHALSSCWRAAIVKRDSRNSWMATSPRWSSPRPTSIGCSNPRPTNSPVCARAARAILDACEIMVLPLALNPTAPGQGALALEIRRDRDDLAELLAGINDQATFGRVIAERARLAPTGDEDHPLGVSIVPIHCGEVEFTRGQKAGQWIQSAELRRHDSPLPPASNPQRRVDWR
jgi:hydroxymethylbilane synthase